MAILPINSVGVKTQTHKAITFKGNESNDLEHIEANNSGIANKYVTVPAALLLAMSTAILNAKEPVQANNLETTNNIEMLASTSSVTSETSGSQAVKTNWVDIDKHYNVRFVRDYECGVNKNTMIFAQAKDSQAKNEKGQYIIDKVFLIPTNSFCVEDSYTPHITELIYHDLPNGKAFCGAMYSGIGSHYKTGKPTTYFNYETRLDNETANVIIDLIAGDGKYALRDGGTPIEFSETKSAQIR